MKSKKKINKIFNKTFQNNFKSKKYNSGTPNFRRALFRSVRNSYNTK